MHVIDILFRSSRIVPINLALSFCARHQRKAGHAYLERGQPENAMNAFYRAVMCGLEDTGSWNSISDLLSMAGNPSTKWLGTARYHGSHIGRLIASGNPGLAEEMIVNVMGKINPGSPVSDVSTNYHQRVLGMVLWYLKPGMRDRYANLFLKILRPKLEAPSAPVTHASDVARGITEKGFHRLGVMLTKEQVLDILDYLGNQKCKPGHYYSYSKKQELSVDETEKAGCHYASYCRDVIVRAPHLLELCNRAEILDAVEKYLGCTPTLCSINVFWTFGSRQTPGGVSVYHRDINDFRCVGMYVYLTDVGLETGAHAYVSRSSDPEFCKKSLEAHGMNDVEHEIFFKPPWGNDLVPTVFANDIVLFTGEAGTAFMHDTYGLHAGTTPKSGRRLIFYVVYSTMPLENPVNMPRIRIQEPVPSYLMSKKNRYVNRVYFDC